MNWAKFYGTLLATAVWTNAWWATAIVSWPLLYLVVGFGCVLLVTVTVYALADNWEGASVRETSTNWAKIYITIALTAFTTSMWWVCVLYHAPLGFLGGTCGAAVIGATVITSLVDTWNDE